MFTKLQVDRRKTDKIIHKRNRPGLHTHPVIFECLCCAGVLCLLIFNLTKDLSKTSYLVKNHIERAKLFATQKLSDAMRRPSANIKHKEC
jgi:hypothetical protein